MDPGYLLTSTTAKVLYDTVREQPIWDYHCHLSPREIWEDHPFDNIGEMWLAGDHYKWRLMRACGVPEERITGGASWRDKFLAYARAVSMAAGNPLYDWTRMELSRIFGIETPLNGETAEDIWTRANRIVKEEGLSPRKLIARFRVRYIATTDDAADTLEFHRMLRQTGGFETVVAPSFRTDMLLNLRREGYAAYIAVLSGAAGVPIRHIQDFKEAIRRRLDVFQQAGCTFTDVGLPDFPSIVGTEGEADTVFRAALSGEEVSPEAYDAFLGHMFVFLGGEYWRRGLVMQWHLAAARNVNTRLNRALGSDCGGDCIGDPVPGNRLLTILDAIGETGGLPETILYTLNPSCLDQLVSIAGSFPGVRVGPAWWFCDHLDGIADTLRTVARIGHLTTFPGMLTDSRSFLSYPRHEYYRRILCSVLGRWVEDGLFVGDAGELAGLLCGETVRRMVEERRGER